MLLLLYGIEIEGKKSYKSPHTTHMTPHSSLHRWQKDLYWYPQKPCPTAQPGEVHKDHTTYKTAPVKEKDLHVVSSFLSFGDEVANTEESTVLMCL